MQRLANSPLHSRSIASPSKLRLVRSQLCETRSKLSFTSPQRNSRRAEGRGCGGLQRGSEYRVCIAMSTLRAVKSSLHEKLLRKLSLPLIASPRKYLHGGYLSCIRFFICNPGEALEADRRGSVSTSRDDGSFPSKTCQLNADVCKQCRLLATSTRRIISLQAQ